MAIALIVVGPDKLPDLAKTVARQLLELKKAAGNLKDSLEEEMKQETPAPPIAETDQGPQLPAGQAATAPETVGEPDATTGAAQTPGRTAQPQDPPPTAGGQPE